MAAPRPALSARSPGKTVLRLGGTAAASVATFQGGEPFADVVTEPGGLLPYAKKHVGDLRFADLEAQLAMDAHPVLYRWIRDTWLGDPDRDFVAFDTGGNSPQTLELARARIRDVVLPALDSASLERCYLTLRIAPRGVRRLKRQDPAQMEREPRDFLARNFSVAIDGLDCGGVLALDSFAVHTDLPAEGTHKKPQLVFPDLHLKVDAERADAFREWFEDFIIGGNNDDDKERDGTITYLDPMLGEALAVLQLRHLGIYRIAEEPLASSGPATVRVDLYCERMELSASDAPSGDTDQVPPVND